jgi:hypothetical protein
VPFPATAHHRKEPDVTQAVATAPAPAAQQQAAAKAPVILKPFKVGAQYIDTDPFDRTVTLNAGTQNLDQFEIGGDGYLTDVYILVENTVTTSTATATGTASVGVLLEDAPYTVLDSLVFTDTGGGEIVGPINGFDLYVIDKWGGYRFQDDPEANTDLFTSVSNATASSSASGSFSFMLRIPVEIVPRDALGALPNKSSSTPFKVKTRVAAIASVFASASTVGGSCRIRMFPVNYWEPTRDDGSGNAVADQPPGVNTTQYWNVTPYTSALNLSQILSNSVGYPNRNLGFVVRDVNGSRATGETDFPDPFLLQLQSNIVINRNKKIWKRRMTADYGYTAAGDAAGQKDNGLYWETYCRDFQAKPGWENRRGLLRTTDGMKMQIKGTFGGSGNHVITVYTNYYGIPQGVTLGQLTT